MQRIARLLMWGGLVLLVLSIRYGLEMVRPRERRPPRLPNATPAGSSRTRWLLVSASLPAI